LRGQRTRGSGPPRDAPACWVRVPQPCGASRVSHVLLTPCPRRGGFVRRVGSGRTTSCPSAFASSGKWNARSAASWRDGLARRGSRSSCLPCCRLMPVASRRLWRRDSNSLCLSGGRSPTAWHTMGPRRRCGASPPACMSPPGEGWRVHTRMRRRSWGLPLPPRGRGLG
jgi:hypothetical protein